MEKDSKKLLEIFEKSREFREAIIKAVADPIAILIEIISAKLVETKKVKIIPIKKPIKTT